jgi:hypothetical protein
LPRMEAGPNPAARVGPLTEETRRSNDNTGDPEMKPKTKEEKRKSRKMTELMYKMRDASHLARELNFNGVRFWLHMAMNAVGEEYEVSTHLTEAKATA